jgi:tetratricopeptide (TPR) repeat protein
MVFFRLSEKNFVKTLFIKKCGPLFSTLLILLVCTCTFGAEPASSESEMGQDDGGMAYIRGKELILKGDFEAALPFLEQARKSDPQSPTVNSQLAEAYLRVNQPEKAEEYGKKAVEFANEQIVWISSPEIQQLYLKNPKELRIECQKRINFFVNFLHEKGGQGWDGKLHFKLRDIRNLAYLCIK